MKHKLKINVANDSPKEGIVACKKKKVRRGLLRKLFGADLDIWSYLIDKAVVNRDGSITFNFRNGKEIKIN